MPPWAAQYVGLPFAELGRDRDGCDCYGLVRLVLTEQFGRTPPAYVDYDTTRDTEKLDALFAQHVPEWQAVERPAVGDVVLFRTRGLSSHVGLVIAPGQMLHVMRGINACVERFDSMHWRNRIVGFYRYL